MSREVRRATPIASGQVRIGTHCYMLVATSEPVVGAVAAWLALGERLEAPQIAGGAVVLIAIVLAQTLRPTAGSV